MTELDESAALMDASPYPFLADLLLLLHVLVVLFVLGGFLCILAGNRFGWRWVNSRRFRIVHLGIILLIAGESWLGISCPLTTWENWLRNRGGQAGYATGFVEYWLQRLLYYEAPNWVFVLCYSLFALAVVATWHFFPPTTTGARGNATALRAAGERDLR